MILRPSEMVDDEPRRVTGAGREAARLRGTLTHQLLQSLPDIPAAAPGKTAEANFFHEEAANCRRINALPSLRDVLLLFASKDFAALFSPGSRAEVPIVGTLNEADRRFPARSIAFRSHRAPS